MLEAKHHRARHLRILPEKSKDGRGLRSSLINTSIRVATGEQTKKGGEFNIQSLACPSPLLDGLRYHVGGVCRANRPLKVESQFAETPAAIRHHRPLSHPNELRHPPTYPLPQPP